MTEPKTPETPKSGYTSLGDHDPCEHAHDYVDGDTDDYGAGECIPETRNEEDDA